MSRPSPALPRRRVAAIAAAAAIGLVLSAPASSFAYWSAAAPAVTAPLSVAAVPVPGGFACASMPGLLGLTPYAKLSWSAVSGATSYQVWLRSADGATRVQLTRADPTALTQEVRDSLLTGLLGTLKDLLVGNQTVYAEVIAVHSSGWHSSPTAGAGIARAGLLPGILGGLKCTP